MKTVEEAKELALTNFSSEYNCAESVVGAIAKAYGKDIDLAMKIATGFGGGVSRQGRDCGAVSGAVIGFGLLHGRTNSEELRANTYRPVTMFYEQFRKRFGSVVCKDLCGCDISTKEGLAKFRDGHVHKNLCSNFVSGAVEIFMNIEKKYIENTDHCTS
ncbi:MAG: hypothetical protein GTN36_04530 [Candidatus Aenigmarchaeota archaeon]|nr:hypothetical protein [Candidatus Aenigmarchaeota archaeon]